MPKTIEVSTTFKGYKIFTGHKNLFIQLIAITGGRSLNSFFFMKSNGERYVTALEIKKGVPTTSFAWADAKEKWGNPVEKLSPKELAMAIKLHEEIKKDFLFSFSKEQRTSREIILNGQLTALRAKINGK